jgi:hypothetical protein
MPQLLNITNKFLCVICFLGGRTSAATFPIMRLQVPAISLAPFPVDIMKTRLKHIKISSSLQAAEFQSAHRKTPFGM